MMKERYRNMIEQMSLSEQAKAAFEQKLETVRPVKKRTRVLRAALIAACACLVLVGGAFAAEFISNAVILEFFAGKTISEQESPRDGYAVTFTSLKQYAVDEFSEELRDWLAIPRGEREITREFEDWDDAEAFLGVELMNNSILDELGKETVMNNQHCWGVFFDTEGQLERAEITAYYNYKLEEGCDLIVVAGIVTEYQNDYDNSFWMSHWETGKGDAVVVGDYITPSGLSVSVLQTLVGHRVFFSINGVAYRIEVLNEPIETVYEFLNAIEV